MVLLMYNLFKTKQLFPFCFHVPPFDEIRSERRGADIKNHSSNNLGMILSLRNHEQKTSGAEDVNITRKNSSNQLSLIIYLSNSEVTEEERSARC